VRRVPVRTQTLVQLTDELLNLLDRRAADRGLSRSAVIRELLEEGLRGERSREIDRRLVEGYSRAPQETAADTWGDLDAWTDRNARRNLAALGREEPEPW
jgi:hypothetical protein